MFVSRKLHYCGSSYSPGYTSDFLGIPIDLGYQLRDFSVSVLTWKMGLRIREILIAIPNNRTKFYLHFRFLQALQGEHSFPVRLGRKDPRKVKPQASVSFLYRVA